MYSTKNEIIRTCKWALLFWHCDICHVFNPKIDSYFGKASAQGCPQSSFTSQTTRTKDQPRSQRTWIHSLRRYILLSRTFFQHHPRCPLPICSPSSWSPEWPAWRPIESRSRLPPAVWYLAVTSTLKHASLWLPQPAVGQLHRFITFRPYRGGPVSRVSL